MADGVPAPAAAENAKQRGRDKKPTCGIIMPISETTSHTEEHWRRVQVLVHRAVSEAGFAPQNVWDNTSTDRISERIIGNIFEVPIVVADISDLNPNVMLELGLRLASKKPTVVIANAGGDIPFDIRDFHASFYPADLNILDMEDFFRRLAKVLQDKYAAFTSEGYTPFLGKVIVDVASPQTREVGFNELLLSRLDEITSRLGTVETAVRRPRPARTVSPSKRVWSGSVGVEIPKDGVEGFIDAVLDLEGVDAVSEGKEKNGLVPLAVAYNAVDSTVNMHSAIEAIAKQHGGDTDIPF